MNDAHVGRSRLAFALPPTRVDVDRCDRWLAQRLRGGLGSARGGCVRTAQAGKLCAWERLKAAIMVFAIATLPSSTASMPPAAKKFLAKVARAVNSSRPQIGEENFRPRAGRRQHAVGCVAQGLEGFGEPNARQRLGPGHRRTVGRQHHWRNVEHRYGCFIEIGKLVGADERIRASGDGAHALGAHRRDLALNEAGFERGPGAARLLDLLEQRPCARRKAFASSPRCRRSRRRDRRPWRGLPPPAG